MRRLIATGQRSLDPSREPSCLSPKRHRRTEASGLFSLEMQGQDDLREKLLSLLSLSSANSNGGLDSFRDSGYFLLQSFPRPLKVSIGNVRSGDLKNLLAHQVKTHLRSQITFFHPSAILALGKPASVALSTLFPDSPFTRSFESGDFAAVQGKMFEEPNQPLLSATYLPSGNGRFWRRFWERHMPLFVKKARSLA